MPLFATENGKPLDRSQWAERVREYCQRAGVKVTPYDLRHTFFDFVSQTQEKIGK